MDCSKLETFQSCVDWTNTRTPQATSTVPIEKTSNRGVRSSRCYAFGCIAAIRGGYRKTRGWHLTKLSLSSALLLSFSDMCFVLCSFLFVVFFCFVFALFRLPCPRWSFVGVPLIFSCPTDHVPDWQPRIVLGTVEARSVNVKNTTTEDLDTFRVLLIPQPEGVVHSLARSVVQVSRCCL